MNHIGEVYGLYQIVNLVEERANDGHKQYLVHCAICDAEFVTQMSKLKYTKVKHNMCSIHNKEKKIKDKNIRKIFHCMKNRCYNSQDKDYNTYGGKGIKICSEWMKSPMQFEKWAIESGYANGLTIDRINSNKNYCPENCRWLTREENARFKSTTNVINVDGRSMTGRQWAKYLHIGDNVINNVFRNYGKDKTVCLIQKMLMHRPNIDVVLKHGQSWLDAYGIK